MEFKDKYLIITKKLDLRIIILEINMHYNLNKYIYRLKVKIVNKILILKIQNVYIYKIGFENHIIYTSRNW